MARQILSLSPVHESSLPDPRGSLAEAHQLLGTLEQVTRQSLQRTTPEPVAEPEVTAPAFVPTPTQKVRVKPQPFGTSRDEYRPALGNPSLVRALAELQARAQSRSRRTSLIKATELAQAGQTRPSETAEITVPLFSAEDFLAAEIPEVQAAPKPSLPLGRTPGVGQAILRPE